MSEGVKTTRFLLVRLSPDRGRPIVCLMSELGQGRNGGKQAEEPLAFEGRRALVLGGSGGIGKALSVELSRRGAEVLVHGRSPAKVDAVVGAIRARGDRAAGLAAEISSLATFLSLLGPFGYFDVVVVAFGPFLRRSLAETRASDWESLALLDLALPGALASTFLPDMLARGYGRFLFFGGTRTDAIRAYRSNAAYASAKTGLGVLTKSLAAEGAGRNVAALLVCPGFVDTEYLSASMRAEALAMAPGAELIPASRIAETALDLLAQEPCAASGALLSLDAGFSPQV